MIDLQHAFESPTLKHWLGTDPYGTDLGARLFSGAAISFTTAISVTLITMSVGIFIATLTALAPRMAAGFLRRIIDAFLAFPGLLLAILLASVMPPSNSTVIFALSITGWAAHARLFTALIKNTLTFPYIEAARASGATSSHIIVRHVWPSLFAQIFVQALFSMAHAILGEASLSFLGMGGPVDSPSWGRLIAEGRQYLVEAPHLSIVPGLALMIVLFSIYFAATKMQNRMKLG